MLASFISGDRAAHWGARSLKDRRAAVLADLVTFFGPQAASPLEYNEGNWPSNPWEGGAYAAYFTPGTWTEYGRSLRAPVGRIFWAGTETAKKWAVSQRGWGAAQVPGTGPGGKGQGAGHNMHVPFGNQVCCGGAGPRSAATQVLTYTPVTH